MKAVEVVTVAVVLTGMSGLFLARRVEEWSFAVGRFPVCWIWLILESSNVVFLGCKHPGGRHNR